jgi:hypothetical protein
MSFQETPHLAPWFPFFLTLLFAQSSSIKSRAGGEFTLTRALKIHNSVVFRWFSGTSDALRISCLCNCQVPQLSPIRQSTEQPVCKIRFAIANHLQGALPLICQTGAARTAFNGPEKSATRKIPHPVSAGRVASQARVAGRPAVLA